MDKLIKFFNFISKINMRLLMIMALAFAINGIHAQQCELYAPNAFSPDGDGRNEYWQVSLPDSCYIEYTCHVFNRYGDVIWQSSDPNEQWNGGYNFSGYYVQNEQYIYLIVYRSIEHSQRCIGSITVIR
jgi:gliding motility-associated-like protein